MMEYLIIVFGTSALGILLIGIRVLYYKRKNSHLHLRLAATDGISEVIENMKKHSKLTQKQRDYFKTILQLSETKSIVRSYLWNFIIKGGRGEKLPFQLSNLGIKKGDKLFDDATDFVTFCALHASTYNFFLGSIFRKIMLGDSLQPSKLLKIAVKQKDFVKRSDVLSAFGDTPKTA